MSAGAGTVTVEVADGAARIVLDRPETLNSWNEDLGRDLGAAVEAAGADDDVRAVLITGAGRAFSSGADLREQRGGVEGAPPDLSQRLRELYNPIILGVREMPKPVIAAVNGPAAGIGCSLALACDLIVAAESAFFLLAFVNIGLVPDGGVTAVLPARAGAARAAEMAMLGERIPAEQALEWGLINRVVADDDLDREAGELLARLAAGPTRAYANIKQLLNRTLYAGLGSQLDAEAEAQRQQGLTGDFIEGVLAFAEKRPPRFVGAAESQSPSSWCPGGTAPVCPGGAGLPAASAPSAAWAPTCRRWVPGRRRRAPRRASPARCRAGRRRTSSAPGAPEWPRRSGRRRPAPCRGCRARSCRSARRPSPAAGRPPSGAPGRPRRSGPR